MRELSFVVEYNGIQSEENSILHVLKSEKIQVYLEIDPKEASSCDDKYILFSTDKARSYQKALIVKDHKIDGEHKITLEYDIIKKDINYSLIIYLGTNNDSYALFENMSYHDLIK